MGFGISSASFFPVQTEETVEIIKAAGADKAEFFLEATYEYEPDYISMLKDICTDNGITPISVHSFCSAFEPFIFTTYERRRKDCMDMYRRVLSAAQGLGVKYYTFHGEGVRDSYDIDQYAEKYAQLAQIASEYGVILTQENVSWCMSCDPQFTKGIIERVNSPWLKCTLDIKQAYRANKTPADYVSALGENIVNVHINDRTSEKICLLPGDGDVDFASLFTTLDTAGYRGDYILEVYRRDYTDYSQIKASLDHLKRIKEQL